MLFLKGFVLIFILLDFFDKFEIVIFLYLEFWFWIIVEVIILDILIYIYYLNGFSI